MMVHFNPWRDLNRIERAMQSRFGGRDPSYFAPRDEAASWDGDEPMQATVWQPPVDIFEDADKIRLLVDLPGVEQEAIDISVDKNVLTLKGERRTIHEAGGGKEATAAGAAPTTEAKRIERVHGQFVRAFTLPSTVDSEKVAGELKNGVLTLTLPKKVEAQPRQIKVQLKS